MNKMKQGFFASSQSSTLFQYSVLFSALLLAGCKGGSSNAPAENVPPPVTTPSDYALEIAPASEQIKALPLYTQTSVELAPYIKSDGLINLRLASFLSVNKALGIKDGQKNPCELAKASGLGIAIAFSKAGACMLEYQVIGETLEGQKVTKQGQITLIGSQQPEYAVLQPMSLVLINPAKSKPYGIDLDANPPTLSIGGGGIGRQISGINNDVLITGNYEFPAGFSLTDLTLEGGEEGGTGKGEAEANKDQNGWVNTNNIKYTAEDSQLGYSKITYLIEKEGVEAQLGQIHISVNAPNNQAPRAYDFCQSISPTSTDANGNLFTEVDLTPYVYDPDKLTHLTLTSLLSLTGTFTPDDGDPLKFRFTTTEANTPYHLISYLLKDGQGGFDTGQIKLVLDDGASRVTHTMSAGYGFGYRLDEMGSLWVTGENNHGNLGTGNQEKQEAWIQPLAVENTRFEAVAANQGNPIQNNNPAAAWRYGYLLDTDGFIWVSGNNYLGQLGTGGNTDISTWQKITTCKLDDNDAATCPTFTQISAGSVHGYALDTKGRIWSAGYNHYGQLGRNDASLSPERPYLHSPLWGISLCSNTYGEESKNANNDIDCPVFTSVNAGPFHGYAIDDAKNLWVIGNNRNGQLGVGEAISMGDNTDNSKLGGSQYRWIKISKVRDQDGGLINASSFVQVSAGGGNSTNSFGYALDDEGYLYATGDGSNGKLANAYLSDEANKRTHTWGKITHARRLVDGTDLPVLFKEVSAGHEHAYALAKDCGIWGVGANSHGQLATGSNNPSQSSKWILPKKSDNRYFSGVNVSELTTGAYMGYIKNNGTPWGVGEKNGLGLADFNLAENNRLSEEDMLPEENNVYLWQKLPSLLN